MLALNNAHAPHVTAIDAGELQSLIDQAFTWACAAKAAMLL
jgi:predicted GNAT superfamily acetyltransferase